MRKAIPILLALAAVGLAGCDDSSTAPRDVTPPAAPRGVFSVTGDQSVTIGWLANTEADVAGYRIYMAPCASGTTCPYDRVGSTASTQFVATALPNGVTRYFAVAAVDRAGNESALSAEDVFDTPRPRGSGTLTNSATAPASAGWDFSAFTVRPFDNAATDVYFNYNGSVYLMVGLDITDLQDAGYTTSFDEAGYSPVGNTAGWSPTHTVELIPGHTYYVWTRDDHYAKFRVTGLSPGLVSFDWGYQTAVGNPELHARRSRPGSANPDPLAGNRR